MKITLTNGDVYRIHFMYGRYDGRRQVRCEIHTGECVDTIYRGSEICGAKPKGVGFAWCSHLDEFVKAKGRKIALARAMNQFYDSNQPMLTVSMPRVTRTQVWHAYLAITNERIPL